MRKVDKGGGGYGEKRNLNFVFQTESSCCNDGGDMKTLNEEHDIEETPQGFKSRREYKFSLLNESIPDAEAVDATTGAAGNPLQLGFQQFREYQENVGNSELLSKQLR